MKTSSSERIRLGSSAPKGVRILDGGDCDPLDGFLRRVRARAFEEGRIRGAADATLGQAALLARSVEALERERERYCETLSLTAVEIALRIARELLRSEISRGRHDIQRIVRETLRSSSAGRSRCVVHLNPADVEALQGVAFRSGTILQPDIGVPRGDVQVETSLGLHVREMDGALESIGERLREKLR